MQIQMDSLGNINLEGTAPSVPKDITKEPQRTVISPRTLSSVLRREIQGASLLLQRLIRYRMSIDQVRRAGSDKDIRWPQKKRVAISEIKKVVCETYDCQISDLYEHGHRAGESKRVAIGLACRLSGLSNREIGKIFNHLKAGAIGYHKKRFAHDLRESKELQSTVTAILEDWGYGQNIE